MFDNEMSVIYHLRVVANKLEISQNVNLEGLCEREIVSLLQQYYQDLEEGRKRKSAQESSADEKKRKLQKRDNLCALKELPNEIYEKILICLWPIDLKNLRETSKGLYEKTTLMCPMFNFWTFDACRGTPPDFVLATDKTFRVYFEEENTRRDPSFSIKTISNLVNRFGYRISSLRLETDNVSLMEQLDAMKPSEFPHLTSLIFEFDYNSASQGYFNSSILMLAPQLEHLELHDFSTKLDLSSAIENSKSFTKLKTLTARNSGENGVKVILSKCLKSLKQMHLNSIDFEFLKNYKQDLPSLHTLKIYLTSIESLQGVQNLLSKCNRSLKTLDIEVFVSLDLSTLSKVNLNITTFRLYAVTYGCDTKGVEQFLNQCPLLQKLSLKIYNNEVKQVVLKNLRKLEFYECSAKCMESVLNQVPGLRTLVVKGDVEQLDGCEFSVVPHLDTVWLEGHVRYKGDLYGFVDMFPKNAEVKIEKKEVMNKVGREMTKEKWTVVRRVFN